MPIYAYIVTTLVGVVIWWLCRRLTTLTCSGLTFDKGRLKHSKANPSVEATSVSISVAWVRTYVQTKVQMTTEFYRSILKPWNVTAIMCMPIQCVPGTPFPSLYRQGTRLGLSSKSGPQKRTLMIILAHVLCNLRTRTSSVYWLHMSIVMIDDIYN